MTGPAALHVSALLRSALGPYPASEQSLPDGEDGAGDVFVPPMSSCIHMVHLTPRVHVSAPFNPLDRQDRSAVCCKHAGDWSLN